MTTFDPLFAPKIEDAQFFVLRSREIEEPPSSKKTRPFEAPSVSSIFTPEEGIFRILNPSTPRAGRGLRTAEKRSGRSGAMPGGEMGQSAKEYHGSVGPAEN